MVAGMGCELGDDHHRYECRDCGARFDGTRILLQGPDLCRDTLTDCLERFERIESQLRVNPSYAGIERVKMISKNAMRELRAILNASHHDAEITPRT
jgi:SRSO17 transposase